jgi:uncharacterized protein YceK
MRSALVILAMCSLSLSSCGTFSDGFCGPVDDHIFYRGVRLDCEAITEGGPMVLMAADIPFSALADTILVPYLACEQLTNPPRRSVQSKSDDHAIGDKGNPDSVFESVPKK